MYFPSELVELVLCWVSVKYVLRCRCVSKEWLSIIDNVVFVKKHFRTSIECNATGLIFECDDKFYLTDNESLCDNNVDVVDISDTVKTVFKNAQFLGAANGLVCFCEGNKNEFLVINPMIRKFRKVPSVPSEFVRTDGLSEHLLCGFGYDHVNDDYKVVRMAEFVEPEHRLNFIVVVYSMKMDSWTRIRDVPSNMCVTPDLGRFASGVLYWLGLKYENGKVLDAIVGFDLGLQQFREVPSPVSHGKFFYLVSINESLCVLDNCHNYFMDVWLMNSDGGENLWYKAFSEELPSVFGSFKGVKPVSFSGNGKDVLLEVDRTKLVWYDLEKKTGKSVEICGIPNKFVSYLYTESLLLLTEGKQLQTPLHDKKEKKRQKKKWHMAPKFEKFWCCSPLSEYRPCSRNAQKKDERQVEI